MRVRVSLSVSVEPGGCERGSVQTLGNGGGGGASEHAEEAGLDCCRAAPQEVGGRGRGGETRGGRPGHDAAGCTRLVGPSQIGV